MRLRTLVGARASRKTLVTLLALALMLVVAPAAYAKPDDAPLSCALGLAVIVAGSEVADGTEVYTSGEQTLGGLGCDVAGLSGIFTTTHDSEIVLDLSDGSFSGKLEGTFTMDTAAYGVLTGEIEATISGRFTESGPVLTDAGTWEINDGSIEGKGDFEIHLSLVELFPGVFTLAGSGSLTGTLELDDDDSDDDDDD